MSIEWEEQCENDLANGECLRELCEDITSIDHSVSGTTTATVMIIFSSRESANDFLEVLDEMRQGVD